MMRAEECDAIVAGLQTVGFTGVLILMGNNAQLGPVLRRSSIASFIAHHITKSRALQAPTCKRFRLTTNMRMQRDPAFLDACTRIGYAREPAVNDDLGLDGSHLVRLPTALFHAVPDDTTSIQHARRWVHSSMYEDHATYTFGNVIVCPTRAYEHEHNAHFLNMLPGEATVYHARDEVVPKAGQHADFEALVLSDDLGSALDDSGKPRYELPLKPGAPVQLLQTLVSVAGLDKGRVAIVHSCDRHSVVIRFESGQLHRIPRTTFQYSPEHFRRCVDINRHQLPLTLNWASTVHRVQGDTVARELFDLRHPVFCHGQLYTGIGRVSTADDLKLIVPTDDFSDDGGEFVTTNIVVRAVLSS